MRNKGENVTSFYGDEGMNFWYDKPSWEALSSPNFSVSVAEQLSCRPNRKTSKHKLFTLGGSAITSNIKLCVRTKIWWKLKKTVSNYVAEQKTSYRYPGNRVEYSFFSTWHHDFWVLASYYCACIPTDAQNMLKKKFIGYSCKAPGCKRHFKRCPREVNRPYINASQNRLNQSARKSISAGVFWYIHRQIFWSEIKQICNFPRAWQPRE